MFGNLAYVVRRELLELVSHAREISELVVLHLAFGWPCAANVRNGYLRTIHSIAEESTRVHKV